MNDGEGSILQHQGGNPMTPPTQKSLPLREVADDPFKYGWRYVKRTLPNGKTELEQVPLTLEDVLYPEEEDFHITSKQHVEECFYLYAALESLALQPPLVSVECDRRIDWGIEGLRPLGPDVAVFVGMSHRPRRAAGTVYLGETGGRCILAIEVVSPSTRTNNVGPKLKLYHQAKVEQYVIVDQEEEEGPRKLYGYSWTNRGFRKMALDEYDNLLLSGVGLRLSLRDDRLICTKTATGWEYPAPSENFSELEKADQKNQEQTQLYEEIVVAKHAVEQALSKTEQELAKALEELRQLKARTAQ